MISKELSGLFRASNFGLPCFILLSKPCSYLGSAILAFSLAGKDLLSTLNLFVSKLYTQY